MSLPLLALFRPLVRQYLDHCLYEAERRGESTEHIDIAALSTLHQLEIRAEGNEGVLELKDAEIPKEELEKLFLEVIKLYAKHNPEDMAKYQRETRECLSRWGITDC